MGRGLLIFALLVTGGLTLVLGRPASSQRNLRKLDTIVVSSDEAEGVLRVETLRRGEVLAQVLGRQGLTAQEIADVVDALRPYANPRLLRAGVTVTGERTAWDSLIALTVRVDPDTEVRLTEDGYGWNAELGEIPIRLDTLFLAGSIASSLYNSVMELPIESLGSVERIERVMWGVYRPFQWSIDFGVDLRRGDSYRVVYEGRSMKRVFLKAPVDFRRISSRFSRRRYHPKLGIYRAHLGTDYAADTGTRVHSTADGTVTRAGWWGGYGRVIEIRHVNGYRTRYAHLSFIARGIKKGVRVRQGQLIGHVGSSGLATGPHLHFEMWQNGKAVDHRRIDLPSGNPVAKEEIADYMRLRDLLSGLLNRASETGARRAD
jgi:murein DD-endopeptidase MepM/ murein hydrolase activator NlpD